MGLSISWSHIIQSDQFDIVNDAIAGIQKTLSQQGNPYFIKRTYSINDGKISITTKGHYAEYRKEAYYDQNSVNVGNSHYEGDVIEFVYKKTNKNHITRINKKTKTKGPRRQKIEFNCVQANEPGIIDLFSQLVSVKA